MQVLQVVYSPTMSPVKTWHNLSALIVLVLRGMIYLLIISVHLLTTLFQKVRKALLFNIDGSKYSLGLCNSKQENGGYSLPCVFFALSGYQNSNPGVRPLKSFSKALVSMLTKNITRW